MKFLVLITLFTSLSAFSYEDNYESETIEEPIIEHTEERYDMGGYEQPEDVGEFGREEESQDSDY